MNTHERVYIESVSRATPLEENKKVNNNVDVITSNLTRKRHHQIIIIEWRPTVQLIELFPLVDLWKRKGRSSGRS